MSEMKCKTIIETGGNRGKICNRVQCPYHQFKNIAEYFDLPEFFVQFVARNRNWLNYDYTELIQMYERCFEVNDVFHSEFIKIIRTLLLKIETCSQSVGKQIYAIILFKILNTPVSTAFIYTDLFKEFKVATNNKYDHLLMNERLHPEFNDYFSKNFEKFPKYYKYDGGKE